MSAELESKLNKALSVLERASQEFQLKKFSFEEKAKYEALRELIKEQISHENTVPPTRETR